MGILFDFVFLGIALFFLWVGLKNGFLKSIVGFILMLFSTFLSYIFSPILAQKYFENFMYNDLINKVNTILCENGNMETNPFNRWFNYINNIPGFINNDLSKYGINAEEVLIILQKPENKAEHIIKLFEPIIIDMITMFMFFFIFIIAFFILKIVFKLILHLPKLPIVGTLDSFLGLCVGGLKFLIFTFIIALLIKGISLLAPEQYITNAINNAISESTICNQVYNININILEDYLLKN